MRLAPVSAPLCAALLAATLSAGCTQLKSHQGYVIDADLVNSVQPGVDNRDSVVKVLGQPSFRSGFSGGDWYYLSRDSKSYAFNNPHPLQQTTLRISFDAKGTVSAIRRSGEDQVASISPDGHTTPTLGRTRSFFQDLFGNIGTVGAAGSGPSGDNTGGGGGAGGGRTAP